MRIEPPETTGLEGERALRGGSAATARADGSSTPGVCAASGTARCSLSAVRSGRPAGAGTRFRRGLAVRGRRRCVWSQAASRRRAFWTVGSAALAFASGRARRSTPAGLAGIVISSPVAGFRPLRAFCAGLTRTVSCTRPPIRTFWAFPSSSSTTYSSTPSTRFASVRLISARSATALASCVWVNGNGTPRSNDADAQGVLNRARRDKPSASPPLASFGTATPCS